MKNVFSTLLALAVCYVVTGAAIADPGNTWDKVVVGKKRFRLLNGFNNEAVLDTETGRVWEQSPSANTFNWWSALGRCYDLQVGGRKGWRLPTIEELASLTDTSQSPALPPGHPFGFVNTFLYWSATTDAESTGAAWVVNFGNGEVGGFGKTDPGHVWCVRGGQGINGVQQ
jgi:hypothetical protein